MKVAAGRFPPATGPGVAIYGWCKISVVCWRSWTSFEYLDSESRVQNRAECSSWICKGPLLLTPNTPSSSHSLSTTTCPERESDAAKQHQHQDSTGSAWHLGHERPHDATASCGDVRHCAHLAMAGTTTRERRGNDGRKWRVMQGEAAAGGPWDDDWDLRAETGYYHFLPAFPTFPLRQRMEKPGKAEKMVIIRGDEFPIIKTRGWREGVQGQREEQMRWWVMLERTKLSSIVRMLACSQPQGDSDGAVAVSLPGPAFIVVMAMKLVSVRINGIIMISTIIIIIIIIII
jgi:hypothetical protein